MSQPPRISGFTIPATSISQTVPITSFNVSDNIGVYGYYLSESGTTPVATSAGWTRVKPVQFFFSATGLRTIYAWIKDSSGNISNRMSTTVTISSPLMITIGGSGIGTVTSTPPAISCASGSQSGCSYNYASGATLTLLATPNVNSTFDGWSGACSGTANCPLTMDIAKGVTAIFTLAPLVNIGGTGYESLQAAYDAAKDNAISNFWKDILPTHSQLAGVYQLNLRVATMPAIPASAPRPPSRGR